MAYTTVTNGNTYQFNPSQANTSQPAYVKKEKSYGDYRTGMGNGQNYANNVTDNNSWSKNLQSVAQAVQAGSQNQQTNTANNNTNNTLTRMSQNAQVAPSKNAAYQQRNVQEGYTTNDLNQMAQSGFNTLNKAYSTALAKAGNDANRVGLGGSGFEMGSKYGNQNDSVTSNYLNNVQQLYNEIATKGLEAAREDRFRNAEANDANRQFAANYETNLANQNFTNLDTLAGRQQTYANGLNSNDLDWAKYRSDIDFKNKDNMLGAIKTQNDLITQSNQDQLAWAQQNANEAKSDDDAVMERYKQALDMLKTDVTNQTNLTGSYLTAKGQAYAGGKDNGNEYSNGIKLDEILNGLKLAANQ